MFYKFAFWESYDNHFHGISISFWLNKVNYRTLWYVRWCHYHFMLNVPVIQPFTLACHRCNALFHLCIDSQDEERQFAKNLWPRKSLLLLQEKMQIVLKDSANGGEKRTSPPLAYFCYRIKRTSQSKSTDRLSSSSFGLFAHLKEQ